MSMHSFILVPSRQLGFEGWPSCQHNMNYGSAATSGSKTAKNEPLDLRQIALGLASALFATNSCKTIWRKFFVQVLLLHATPFCQQHSFLKAPKMPDPTVC